MVAVLANTSHGDASIAALDLDTHLVPKKPAAADPDLVRRSGRGIAYTRSAFAYLFRKCGGLDEPG